MLRIIPILLLLLLLSSLAWSSEPIGSYNKGSLLNAVKLPAAGEGYMHLYRESDLGWGTEELIGLIQNSAKLMNQLYPGQARLQVEDLGAENGGDILRHGSHENGLDVDLTYYRRDGLEHDPIATGKKYSNPMVIKKKISPNFDHAKNWNLVKALHQSGSINRIFMDGVIKKELCKYAKVIKEYKSHGHVLRSIRHADNHHDHMHTRLNCPTHAKRCIPQIEVPAGSGC
jgi:penicillin-insensitive murein endopeptidase